MYSGPPRYQRWFALFLIAVGWFLFANLAIATVNKIREFPGWTNFLTFPDRNDRTVVSEIGRQPFSDNRQIVTPTVSSNQSVRPTRVSGGASALAIVTPTVNINQSVRPTSTPIPAIQRSVTSVAVQPTTQERFLPPSCRHSGPSLFDSVGQRGEITRNVRIRSSPSNTSGTAIISGTRFEIIGVSRCAIPNGYSAELLFLNVRLIGISGNRTGWIPESGIGSSNRIVYNVRRSN